MQQEENMVNMILKCTNKEVKGQRRMEMNYHCWIRDGSHGNPALGCQFLFIRALFLNLNMGENPVLILNLLFVVTWSHIHLSYNLLLRNENSHKILRLYATWQCSVSLSVTIKAFWVQSATLSN